MAQKSLRVKAKERWPYAYAHPLAFAVAVGWIIGGLILSPFFGVTIASTVIGQAAPLWLSYAWAILVTLSAGGSAWGILRERNDALTSEPLEAAGNVGLAFAFLVFVVAAIAVRGFEVASVAILGFSFMTIGLFIRAGIILLEGRAQRRTVETLGRLHAKNHEH